MIANIHLENLNTPLEPIYTGLTQTYHIKEMTSINTKNTFFYDFFFGNIYAYLNVGISLFRLLLSWLFRCP